MAVTADALSESERAGSARRSSMKRPTSSAAMCVASAALPPLPKRSTLPPSRRQAATRSAAAVTAATHAGCSRPSTAAALSRMRCSASSVAVSVGIDPPGPQPVRLERELVDGGIELDHPLGDLVLEVIAAVQEHVAAAARAGDLATHRAGGTRLRVELVDAVVGDPRGHPLLRLPGGVEQIAE